MLIAIDYDGTYTEDPEAWYAVIRVLQLRHEVICVTMRHEETEDLGFGAPPCMVYYTDRRAKKSFCETNGLQVDVWIDDRPDFILNHAAPRPSIEHANAELRQRVES